MSLYYQDDYVTLYHGDCMEILPTLPAASVQNVLADLPYGTTANKWELFTHNNIDRRLAS
jgi:DNA modification methylase